MYCHLNVKTGSRATGQSAAAKYDYISRDGRYARACQDEVVHVESGSMPAFASSGRASVLGGGRQPRAEQRPAVPLRSPRRCPTRWTWRGGSSWRAVSPRT